MLLPDFKDGGFPINRRSPIIGTVVVVNPDSTKKLVHKVVYNRYDLLEMIKKQKVILLLGVWPGAKNTDCFPLDIKTYSKIIPPPEIHKDIDSALEIEIIMKGDRFEKVLYKPGPHKKDNTPIESTDIKLKKYVISAGLKHRIILK